MDRKKMAFEDSGAASWALALVAAVAVACLVPTLRAARINPLTVLRAE